MKYCGYLILFIGLFTSFVAPEYTSSSLVIRCCAFILAGTTLIIVDRLKPTIPKVTKIKDNEKENK